MPNRILLLLDHRANSHLLAQALAPHYDLVWPVSGQLPDEAFDLVVVDDLALARLRQALQARRQAETPSCLPVIYVTSRQGMKLMTQRVWQAVDDLLVTPIERAELLARIRIHLRARQYSLELKQQNDELRRLDTMKDQFLSIVSHELRTPINALMGFGSALEDGVLGPLNPDQQRYLGKMMAGADHLLGLVDELLDMSRIQAGALYLDWGPVGIAEAIDSCIAGLSPLIDKKGLQLTRRVPDALPAVMADGRRLNQVLINLIDNAIKFTPQGGGIQVRADLDGDRLRLEVQDSGIGIAEADIAKLFQRFNQVDTSFTREASGTGLGLAISRGLVEAHGGTIGVRSEPDEGSTFWFTLPLAGVASPLA